MIWINGRLSWPLVLAIVYATLVTILTDAVWRLVQAPIELIAGSGLALLVAGLTIIVALDMRSKKRRTLQAGGSFIPRTS